MDKETAIALEMALDGQRDFDMKVISILIQIAKILPDESRVKIAEEIMELIEEHKGGLDDMRRLHSALHGKPNDEE